MGSGPAGAPPSVGAMVGRTSSTGTLPDGTRADRLTALLVEDEQSVSEAIAFLLQRDGFRVEWATTGPLAVRLFDQLSPDLVLLDLMLPGLDGLDVCRRIRATSEVPVVMVTARDSPADRALGLAAGADAYLTKPFTAAQPLTTIRDVLHQHRARAADRPATQQVPDHPIVLPEDDRPVPVHRARHWQSWRRPRDR